MVAIRVAFAVVHSSLCAEGIHPWIESLTRRPLSVISSHLQFAALQLQVRVVAARNGACASVCYLGYRGGASLLLRVQGKHQRDGEAPHTVYLFCRFKFCTLGQKFKMQALFGEPCRVRVVVYKYVPISYV